METATSRHRCIARYLPPASLIVTETTTQPTAVDQTPWTIDHHVEPIRIRDPLAEALAAVDRGAPLVITYRDVVKAAGHTCPTSAGAFRIAQLGLDALYPDATPARGEIEVAVGGPPTDQAHGVTGRLVSYITGAADESGFGGLPGGFGDRRHDLAYAPDDDPDVTVALRRTDTGDAITVTYHAGDLLQAAKQQLADDDPVSTYLQNRSTATDAERDAFADAWHARVETTLTDDAYFTVEDSATLFEHATDG